MGVVDGNRKTAMGLLMILEVEWWCELKEERNEWGVRGLSRRAGRVTLPG
jgi:hypothetical protein